jgi:hypothetical protein
MCLVLLYLCRRFKKLGAKERQKQNKKGAPLDKN